MKIENECVAPFVHFTGQACRRLMRFQLMKFIRLLFAGLVAATAAKAAEPLAEKGYANAMREMRIGWLTRIPEKGSFKTQDEVVAVVMDWPLGDQTVTVLCSSGGDASLYTTATFGIIGGIGHEKVRNAAVAFIECAQHFVGLTAPTKEFPYPNAETLRFYMVTPSGTRTVDFPLKDVGRDSSPASKLYGAAQRVVSELRLIIQEKK